MLLTMSEFRLWTTNEFQTRNDLEAAHDELVEPLVDGFSPGGARVRLDESGSGCTVAAAEFEGFLRPLWGIVPYIYGGADFKHAALYRNGLVNGCNPAHEEFWGHPGDFDQILVDLAAIAFAICFTKNVFWDPLTSEQKDVVSQYLMEARIKKYPNNNWKFFKVLIDIALELVGFNLENSSTLQFLADLESNYLGDGWYGDGKSHRIDYYNPFAFHFYGLIYVKLKYNVDPDRCKRFMDRATQFAGQFIHWFSDDGASLPYGRSLNYRFSAVSFWGIYASVLNPEDTPVIPWGVMKGLYLNNFKWWSNQPIFNLGSKVLSLGYSYPNNFMTERYNSPQSPYWATKAFSGLFMGESHLFWRSETQPLKLKSRYLDIVGMHMSHQKSNTIALINGPWNDEYQTEKYTKFAYSTRYGFGVVTNHRTFPLAHLDNMIGFSVDNRVFYVREEYKAYTTADGNLVSKWTPFEGIEVETYMFPKSNCHIRTHYIKNHTDKYIYTKEGGFAVNVCRKKKLEKKIELFQAEALTEDDYSLIKDLGQSRTPNVCLPEPNSNILYAKTLLPELLGKLPPDSETVYSSVIMAYPTINQTVLLDDDIPGHLKVKSSDEELKRVVCND